MTVDTRADPARAAVLDALGNAIDRFALRERDHRKHGRIVEAEGTHQYLAWVQRAYQREFRNPPPRARCACSICTWVDVNPEPRKLS